MTTFERIKILAEKRKINLKSLASNLGFSENYFYNMKNTQSSPSSEILTKVADYFHVSVDYLLGREEIADIPYLTVEQILDSIENYSGGELNESDREMLRIIIEAKKAAINKEIKNRNISEP
ncbi:helix-turn-helix domain-containing protein [Lactococcus garvieae]|uniref:helix-turn-helix domain-containing protein n=1 Tax=Lactococcus garvieae TaxID=1363 RepID=UPI0018D6DC5E|nr:helix-turn-helix transcriptional regulator [Lactococcus garvieae]QPS71396.1 helix-turn-helix transcriptional regulator [Lactococcus garvieae]